MAMVAGGQSSDSANAGGAGVPVAYAGAPNGPQNGGAAANGAQGQGNLSRSLDSGLAKAAPSAAGLTQSTYRCYRRRLDLFRRQCKRRGQGVALEGAFLVLSQLQDVAWEATEGLDYDDMKLSEEMQYLEPNKELIKIGGHEVMESVANLHRQLGHPNGASEISAQECKSGNFAKPDTSITRWPSTLSTSSGMARSVQSSPSWMNSADTKSPWKSKMSRLRWR